jgi:hypothetical protein
MNIDEKEVNKLRNLLELYKEQNGTTTIAVPESLNYGSCRPECTDMCRTSCSMSCNTYCDGNSNNCWNNSKR